MKEPEYLMELIDAYAFHLGNDAIKIWNDLKSDTRFATWSGSDHPQKHHYGQCGLIRHTGEIIELGFATQKVLKFDMDNEEWFYAALFHDVGKMYDYRRFQNGDFSAAEHKRLIHHISRSGIYWSNLINKYPELSEEYHDKVLHAILAHHGQREWGSPVTPKTRVAWLLHLCDGISARMDDCEKIDYLTLRAAK